MKYKKCNFKLFILLFFTLLFLISCNNYKDNSISNSTSYKDQPSTDEENKKSCSLIFAGDILLHDEQLKAEYDSSTNSYNFNEFFTTIKDYVSNADLAVCNSETTFLGQGSAYSGYPAFNSPVDILSSLKYCGFDILASAHNHILDNGSEGFINTIKEIKNKNFDLIGLKENDNDKNYIIKDVNNIKIGLTNFTYSGENGSTNTFNNIKLPDTLKNRINLFSDDHIDSYIENMKNTINNMKKDGAEYIIFYIHWGIEYETSPNEKQKYLADKLNSLGVDAIIGSHPHVVQPIETIKNKDSGKETLICYSLGNFISNQRGDTMGNNKCADGLMVKLNLTKNDSGKVELSSYDTIPTWVNKYTDSSSKVHYTIVNTEDVIGNENSDNYSEEVFNQIQDSFNSTKNIINK